MLTGTAIPMERAREGGTLTVSERARWGGESGPPKFAKLTFGLM